MSVATFLVNARHALPEQAKRPRKRLSAPALRLAALTAVAAGASGAAIAQQAEKPKWYFHVGPGVLSLEDGANITLNNPASPFFPLAPGFEIHTAPQTTLIFEIGRYVWEDKVSLDFTFGLPPTAEVEGAGFLVNQGRLADVTYGPTALTAKYHFPMAGGKFTPYVGAGVSYMMIFDTKDALWTNVEVDDDIGPVYQAGAEFALTEKWSAYFDVKQAMLETVAVGNFGTDVATAQVKMDPLVISTGIGFKW